MYVIDMHLKSKNHELQLVVFYRFNERIPQGLAVPLLSIKPFAYVVSCYTCQYRKNKRDKKCQ